MLEMKIKITDVDSCTKKLEIELPYAEYQKKLESAYRTLNRKVKVSGFRQGKTPLKILESYYRDRVETDVLQQLVPDTYQEAVQQNDLNAVGQPRLEEVKAEKNEPVKLLLTVEVKPEIDHIVYEGFEFKKVVYKVPSEEVDKETEALRESLAELVEKPDGRIENGDYASIDYQLFIDGQTTPADEKENHTMAVGNQGMDPDFERQLLGMNKGEEKEITVLYPQDHQHESLAGKEAVFKVKIREVKSKILPVLDDEFARQVGEYDTLEELTEDLKSKLEEREEESASSRLKKEVTDKLVAENPVDTPPALVDEEINLRLYHMQMQLQSRGMQFNVTKEVLEKWRENNLDEATQQVKANLLLEKIAQIKELDISDDEVDAGLKKMGELSDVDLQKLKKQMQDDGRLEGFSESLLREKTLKNLIESYKIEDLTEEKPQAQEQDATGLTTNQEKTT